MKSTHPENNVLQQFIIQVPRRRPKKNGIKDPKNRTWIQANRYNENGYASWEHKDNVYFVWFTRDTVPEEGEVVFDSFKIDNIWRFRSLLRCVVELIHI